jgi:hypothetical protein
MLHVHQLALRKWDTLNNVRLLGLCNLMNTNLHVFTENKMYTWLLFDTLIAFLKN